MNPRSARTAVAAAVCLLLGVTSASAQATRTWVSGVGDDVNPCSRTAPCKTFAGAISKTAAGGEISVLDPGGFGAVNITKSITLSGVGMPASILTPSAYGITINAGPTDVVTLRHLQINGAGSGLIGVRVLAGGAVVIDDVTIYGFETGVDTVDAVTTILHSVISNSRLVAVNGRGGTITVESSMISSNNVAVSATLPGVVRLSDNGIYNNYTSFGCGTGTLASAGDNRTAGNAVATPTCAPTVGIVVQ